MKRATIQIVIGAVAVFVTFWLWFFDTIFRNYGIRIWDLIG